MEDKELRPWVSDQLFALLGFAEASLVGFVIALGALASEERSTLGLMSERGGALELRPDVAWYAAACRQESC